MFKSVTHFLNQYKGEIIISSVSVVVSTALSILVALSINTHDPYVVAFYTFGFLVALLMLALLFNQKRLFDKKFTFINQVLTDHFGYASRDNQFFRRREHYADEKKLLARTLVRKVLPNFLDRVYRENPNLLKLNVIIDSGTTLTPVFSELVLSGLVFKKGIEVNIYTNSMSGIEEIHKLETSELYEIPNINLIGGRPLSRYRATTGEATEAFLETLWKEQETFKPNTVTLSILTANWFLVGTGLDCLSICARGTGHLAFKKNVSEHSNYRILVTPLGKLLRLSDVAELNELLRGYEDDEYRSHLIPSTQKDRTLLLTTRRDPHSLSPFVQLTVPLERMEKKKNATNYVLCEISPVYSPPGKTYEEVFINETPHKYVRDNFEIAYGCKPTR